MRRPALFFCFLKIAEAIWGFFWFHTKFWSTCSRSMNYVIDILIGIVWNLKIALGSMDILMMLILLIHEQDICFHLFVSSSISFFNPAEVVADLRDTNSFLKYCYTSQLHRFMVMASCEPVCD